MAGCGTFILIMFGLLMLYAFAQAPGSEFAMLVSIVFLLPMLLAVAALGLVIKLGTSAVAVFLEPSARRRRTRATLRQEAGRLLQDGKFGDVIPLYAAVENGEARLRSVLNERLGAASRWPVGRSLRELARELLLLERTRRAALSYSLPPDLTESIVAEAHDIADRLWDEAGRLAAVAVGEPARLPRLTARLDRRQAELERLRTCVQATRDDLAELTLTGLSPSSANELRSAGDHLRAASAGLRWLSSGDSGDEPQPAPGAITAVRHDADTLWQELRRFLR
jgi:membrane protein implicated in regulation of membrane protease activity